MKIKKSKLVKIVSEVINESTSRINIKNKLHSMITGKEDDVFNTGASVLESYAMSGKSESDEVVSACREFLRDLSIRQARIGRQLHAIEEYENNMNRSYMAGFPFSYGAPGQIHVSRDMLSSLPSMKKEIKEIVRRKSILMDIAEEIEGKTLFDRRSITDVINNPWIMN